MVNCSTPILNLSTIWTDKGCSFNWHKFHYHLEPKIGIIEHSLEAPAIATQQQNLIILLGARLVILRGCLSIALRRSVINGFTVLEALLVVNKNIGGVC